MKRTGGFRRKTRSKLRKNKSEKGKLNIQKFMQTFEAGEKVLLKAEPSYQRGMYFPRHHGKTGTIIRKQGDCYLVQIKDNNKVNEVQSY